MADAPANPPLQELQVRLLEEAVRVLGSESQAAVWLRTPKIALQGMTPNAVLANASGCMKVKQLLDEVWR